MQNRIISNRRENPKSLIISLTNLCTTRCEFCYRRDLHLEPRFFLIEKFRLLLDELGPTLDIVEFSGIGEPLMHDQFKEFALYARQNYPPEELKLQLVTNGSLFSDDLIDFIIGQEFEQVWVSLNAATPETYTALMPGLDFNKVKQSIIRLKDEREKANLIQPLIMLTFVVTKLNYLEAEDFIQLGAMLGADRIEVRSLDRILNTDIYDSLRVSREEFGPILERIETRAQSDSRVGYAPGWAYWPEDFAQPGSEEGKSIYCPNAESVFGVYFSSGEVTPCCYMAAYIENPEYCIGNIYKESALDIWNGQKATALIESLGNLNKTLDICKRCTNYWGKQWTPGKSRPGFFELAAAAIKKNRLVQFYTQSVKTSRE